MCCPLLPAGPAMARCWAGLWARAAWAKGRFVLGGPARAGDLRRASGAARAGAHWLYTREHYAVRESLRKIIDKDINPFVDKWEEEGQFPAHKIFKILGQAGFLGVNKPTEYGGMGLDFSYSIAVAEELGNIRCGGVPMAIGVQTDMATPALTRFGSDELKREFLVPTIAGDVVACLGVSEPGAGSDVASIKTTAVRKGDDYVINGGKMWITSGCQADWMCLLANSSEGPPHQNKSLICLPLKLPARTKNDGLKLQPGQFRLEIGKNFRTVRVINCLGRL
ncbi:putative acyl-CoA dehydrogenase 6 isoform X4 [Carettochelys insculpta]|uniref:putative acyl-CoA dehydrogenase 6 isoform X4 n=1 Tax=Carettochelys insculpta TaxID=44489 RepID=UPI003EBE14EF